MDFAKRFSVLVSESGLPKYKIGEAAGVSDSHIGALCAGKKELGKIETAIALADFFGVSLDYLLCRSSERGASIKKEPVPGISENGRELLSLYEQLPEREQVLLIGEARGLVLAAAEKKKGKVTSASGEMAV